VSLANLVIDGNVGNEPETRTFQNGGELTSFRLGHGQGYMDKQSNQWVDQGTMWVSVVPQSTAAKKVIPYVHKGSRVVVSGRLQQRFYRGNDGSERYALEVRAESISLIPREQKQQAQTQAQSRQPAAGDPWGAAPTGQDEGFGAFGDSDF